MSRAFKKEDSDPENIRSLQEAYERQRIAELGGGSYAKGKAYLESLARRTERRQTGVETVLPTVIRRHTATLRMAKRYAKQSKKLAALIRTAIARQDTLVRLLASTEPGTAESIIARGGRAYGDFAKAIHEVDLELARLKGRRQKVPRPRRPA